MKLLEESFGAGTRASRRLHGDRQKYGAHRARDSAGPISLLHCTARTASTHPRATALRVGLAAALARTVWRTSPRQSVRWAALR